MAILISDPDQTWSEQVRKYFTQLNNVIDVAVNGKDCQLKIYKKNYDSIILDIDTVAHSGFEVLKFIRLNYPAIRIILTIASNERLNNLHISKDELLKMGISSVLIKPYSLEKLVATVEEQNFPESWKNIIENDSLDEEEEIKAPDNEFTRLDLNSMSMENAVIFDCYIRLSKNRFIKIFNRGDLMNKERIDKYFFDEPYRYIYFKTKDRLVYINYMNDLICRVANDNDVSTTKKMVFTKNLTEKYIEEIHVKGLHPQMMKEGKKVCENMYEIIKNSKDISVLMRDYEEKGDDQMTHVFLTSFFAVMVAKNMKWKSVRTIESIALGGLLHDIGKMKLDRKIRDKHADELTNAEFIQYQKHPVYGVELLQKCDGMNESVIQIVYQHHELMDGSGFPNKLSGTKIYPLAKIVCLADAFVHAMMKKKTTPLDTLKELISDRKQVFKYDPNIVKALITCFIKVEEK